MKKLIAIFSLILFILPIYNNSIHAQNNDTQNYNEAFRDAASNGDIKEMKRLIADGADINSKNDDGNTALMSAVINVKCPIDIIKTLIDAGADVNAQDEYGMTALIYSVKVHCMESVQLLLSSGADKELRDKNNKTALIHARVN